MYLRILNDKHCNLTTLSGKLVTIINMTKTFLLFPSIAIICQACSNKPAETRNVSELEPYNIESAEDESVATFASGCFWCAEEIFESLLGVREVVSGYAGGKEEDANYEKVSNGTTDHAESVQVYYDTTVIDFAQLTAAFFAGHDPTTMNQQGPDRGRQYRSVAFYRNEKEKKIIEDAISMLNASGSFKDPIITEIAPFTGFFPAEAYHQDYVERHPNDAYVKGVSKPRFEKFKKQYKGEVKSNK